MDSVSTVLAVAAAVLCAGVYAYRLWKNVALVYPHRRLIGDASVASCYISELFIAFVPKSQRGLPGKSSLCVNPHYLFSRQVSEERAAVSVTSSRELATRHSLLPLMPLH